MDVTDTVPFIALSLSSRFSVAWPALVFTISEVARKQSFGAAFFFFLFFPPPFRVIRPGLGAMYGTWSPGGPVWTLVFSVTFCIYSVTLLHCFRNLLLHLLYFSFVPGRSRVVQPHFFSFCTARSVPGTKTEMIIVTINVKLNSEEDTFAEI